MSVTLANAAGTNGRRGAAGHELELRRYNGQGWRAMFSPEGFGIH